MKALASAVAAASVILLETGVAHAGGPYFGIKAKWWMLLIVILLIVNLICCLSRRR
jgi:hypothetical protein